MEVACPKTLAEFAFACFLYNCFTDFNVTYADFLDSTKLLPVLSDAGHRRALLVWLNKWGCRQFAVNYHGRASDEIFAWYKAHKDDLPSQDLCLSDMNKSDFFKTGKLYDSLMSLTASKKTRSGSELTVTVGPTGAAKILFAIRPKAFVPWDMAMRAGLGYGDSAAEYVRYLKYILSVSECVDKLCQGRGIKLKDLPNTLGRQNAPVTLLIDEYLWITITRNVPMPKAEDYRRWVSWS